MKNYSKNFVCIIYKQTKLLYNLLETHISHPNKVKTKDFLFHFSE